MFRIGLMGAFAAAIARRHHRWMSRTLEELPPPPDADVESPEYVAYIELVQPLERDIDEAAAITIIFAAIAAEAYIYDFAARTLGDRYVARHLDRMALQSKWVVVPRLAVGYSMSTDGQAFQALGELAHDRNELVHPKSRDATSIWGTEEMTKFVQHAEELHGRADRAIRSLEILGQESAEFDTGPFNFLEQIRDEGRSD